MVDFSFISARFLGADDANEVFAPPGEHDPVNLRVCPAQGNEANLSVVFTIVDPLEDLVGENFCGSEERDLVLAQVDSGFLFVPLEFQLHTSPRLSNIRPSFKYNTQMCTQ